MSDRMATVGPGMFWNLPPGWWRLLH